MVSLENLQRQATSSDIIFENHVSKKWLIFRLYKKTAKQLNRNPNGSWAKHMKKHLPKMT